MDSDFRQERLDYFKEITSRKNMVTPKIMSITANYKKNLQLETSSLDVTAQEVKGPHELDEDRKELNKTLKQRKKTLKDLVNTRSHLDEKEAQLQSQLQDIEKQAAVAPRETYEKKLYASISRIQWDKDAKPEECKGKIVGKKNVVPFNLSTKTNSDYFITNHLWDLIAGCDE